MPNLGVRVHNSKTTVGVKRKNMQQYYPNNAAMQQYKETKHQILGQNDLFLSFRICS